MSAQLEAEATAFFDAFVEAFGTFDGSAVAQLFTHPYLAIGSDGGSKVLTSAAATAAYFQAYLDTYKSGGCESCDYHALEVVPIGAGGALVTVTWHLLDARGEVLSSWRESYTVVRSKGVMLAYGSVDHAV